MYDHINVYQNTGKQCDNANEDSLEPVLQVEADESVVEVLGIESADEINNDLIDCLNQKEKNYVLIDIDNDSNDLLEESEDIPMSEEGFVNISDSIEECIETDCDNSIIN